MRIAITGSRGRLGQALLGSLTGAEVYSWSRPAYDLDDPEAASRVVAADAPEVIIHAAAWTDVDACAREPGLARRRNALAVGELARAAVQSGARLVLISTNEVFDGRSNGSPYRSSDPTGAISPYGTSKLEGELAAKVAYAERPSDLLVVRTAWLYGPPGNDFPTKVMSAARRAIAEGKPLRLVEDEAGSPTHTSDLAGAIVTLIRDRVRGTVHVVNSGRASRAAWGKAVLATAGIRPEIALVPAATWTRDSRPPAWGVLASDVPLRPWEEASDEYVRSLTAVLA